VKDETQIVRVDACTTFIIGDASFHPCNVIRKHIADENEQLLQCEYESDRGGKLTVFFRVRNGKWVSFANEYVAEGVIV